MCSSTSCTWELLQSTGASSCHDEYYFPTEEDEDDGTTSVDVGPGGSSRELRLVLRPQLHQILLSIRVMEVGQ
jgi:hypothetical protein